MSQRLGRRYREAWAIVVGVYAIAMAALVLATGLNPPVIAIAIMVCLAAIPLEAIAYHWPKARPALIVIFIAAFALTFFLLNLRLSVEWVILVLIGCAFIAGKIVSFGRDWAVFAIVVVAWQVTDGLANAFHFPWHYHAMIDADKLMFFGNVPAVWLQQHFFDRNHTSWLDVVSVIIYSFHFLLPLSAGFVLWLLNRQLYYRYAVAFCLAALMGFATYVIFPAVPPWLAAESCLHAPHLRCGPGHNQHILPMVAHVQQVVTARLVWLPQFHHYVPIAHRHSVVVYGRSVLDVWNYTMKSWISKNQGNLAFGPIHMGFDQVGAVPSEHVMYPTLVLLFFRKQFGNIANWMVLYVLLVIFCIAYMGQHYVIDAVVGIVYAVIVYAVVMRYYPTVIALFRPRSLRSLPGEPFDEVQPTAAAATQSQPQSESPPVASRV